VDLAIDGHPAQGIVPVGPVEGPALAPRRLARDPDRVAAVLEDPVGRGAPALRRQVAVEVVAAEESPHPALAASQARAVLDDVARAAGLGRPGAAVEGRRVAHLE